MQALEEKVNNSFCPLHLEGKARSANQTLTRCGTALVRSVNKEKSVFSSNAVCSPEPWRFERR
eukprot:3471546-Prymnesium_polylepis.1